MNHGSDVRLHYPLQTLDLILMHTAVFQVQINQHYNSIIIHVHVIYELQLHYKANMKLVVIEIVLEVQDL